MTAGFYTRSVIVLSSLYGFVFASIFAVFAAFTFTTGEGFAGISFGLIALIGLIFIFLQFLISPFLIDLQLSWIYDMNWISIDDLPDDMSSALKSSLTKYGITLKKIGLINDGMPNAFTYGHFKSNARIVFTRGLIDILEPEERTSVLQHEVGHIKNYDFVFMTLASAIPLLFYYTYISSKTVARYTARASKGKRNSAPIFYTIAIISLVIYYFSHLIVLLLSRYREHAADMFSVHETQTPNALSSSLVKISYGLVVAESDKQRKIEDENYPEEKKRALQKRSGYNSAIGMMGLADVNMAKGLVMQAATKGGEVSPDKVAAAASWDLHTPWAKFIELQSTHPLTGKRLKAIDDEAEDIGFKRKYPDLGQVKIPEILWDEFLVDLFVLYVVPPLLFFIPLIFVVIGFIEGTPNLYLGISFLVVAALWYFRVRIKYPGTIHDYDKPEKQENTVMEALTSMERDMYYESSPVRGKPIKITGTVKGRGTPGFVLAEDFMVQDNTGFLVIDYSSIIPFYNLWFGWKKVREIMDQKITVVGWYHRSITPRIQLFRAYTEDGRTFKNRWRGANLVFVYILLGIGIVFSMGLVTLL